jgi:hypothetical protein
MTEKTEKSIARKRAKHAELVEAAPTAEAILAEDVRFLGSVVAAVKIGEPATAVRLRQIMQEAAEKVVEIALKGDGS